MINSPDGEMPQKEERLAGKRPPVSATKAAPGGLLKGEGSASSPTRPNDSGNPSAGPVAGSSPDSDSPPRGRRRRRRKKKQHNGMNGTLVVASAKEGASGQSPEGEISRPKGRKRRRKRGRALQGRPLAGISGTQESALQGSGAQNSKVQNSGMANAGATDGTASPPAGAGAALTGAREGGAIRHRDDARPRSSHDALHPAPQAPRNIHTREDLYAALDLGTNNCRLLIAQPTRPGQFRVVDAFSRIVRLGEGLGATGRLSQGAMDRAVEALKVCAGKLASRKVRLRRLIATEACRSAANGEEFLARVRRETGLDLEIVNRETEARLAVSGCSSLVDRQTDALVLFDIGGGSSEIAMIDLTENRSNRLANHIKAWTSLPVGVVTLSERHGGSTVTPSIFERMVDEVDAMLERFLPPLLPGFALAGESGRFHLLGTSGTVTTLAGLHLELPRYDRRKVDGLWLSNAEVDAMLARLLSWDFDQRAANPCIGADRADLVLAGCAILESIRKRWPSEKMRVADRGLREGLLNEMMAQDGAWRRNSRRRRPRGRGPMPQQGPVSP